MTAENLAHLPFSRPGHFITFEGGEGVGKSTQVKLLCARLAGEGIETLTTREPGGTPTAEALRAILLSGAIASLGPATEAVLFAAARIDHLDQKIRPALRRGIFVVCDRFADSTRAYQGALGKLDPGFIRGLERVAVGRTRPDMTFILDLPAETGLARAAARRSGEGIDRFEGEDRAFHEGLRKAFLDIAAEEPRRCVVVDASGSAEDVAETIWREVQARLLAGSKSAKTSPTEGDIHAMERARG